MKNSFDYLKNILNSPVYDIAIKTSLDELSILSSTLNNKILLKREDTQPTFSFKIRGAYTLMSQFTSDELAKGVITASAGNHGQGVALSSKVLGCKAFIYMPKNTPTIKINAVKSYGAEVILFGENFDEAREKAVLEADKGGNIFIPPFDNPYIISGQGTIGREILEQCKNVSHIFVPIGGGGLAAGICALVKELRPDVKIIGVEPDDSDSMYQAIANNHPVKLSHIGRFCDGVAVKEVGKYSFSLCKQYLDGIIKVDNDAVCAAINDVFYDTRAILEPSGALSLAGLKKWIEKTKLQNANLVAIASGANLNFSQLRYISERAEIGKLLEIRLSILIKEERGSLLNLINLLGDRVVTAFDYRYLQNHNAQIFVGLQISGEVDSNYLIEELKSNSYKINILKSNNLWKTHGHLLSGGEYFNPENEWLFEIDFPERIGALKDFLSLIAINWDIVLFHYRNEGFDYGRVLLSIKKNNMKNELLNILDTIGFQYTEEKIKPRY